MSAAQKERFFERMDELELALTYDDVRMRTGVNRSGQPLPEGIDIQSMFSQHVELKVPFVSAAMDTVTESDMAIAMAKLGGIGIIHAAMPLGDQYKEVRRVKKAIHGKIDKPITVFGDETLEDVLAMCEVGQYDFRTFPVINREGKFIGVLSGNDFRHAEDMAMTVGAAMRPSEQITTASTRTAIRTAYKRMKEQKINTLPLLNERNEIRGLYLFSDVKRIIDESDQYNVDANHQLRTAVAISTGKDTLGKVDKLRKYTDVFVIDTADGDSDYSLDTLRAIKKNFPDTEVVVGNISEGASARELAEAGADGIKVGQGPGSICTTRRETGIGMPQVTAVWEARKALGKEYAHIPISADGGITERGDIPIAIAAGADSVTMGRMLSGTTEAPGQVITRKGTRVKVYRGMGSAAALKSNQASRDRYGANGKQLLPEGVEAYVPFDGNVEDVLELCTLALRKGMRYVKAPNIAYHQKHTSFKRITGSGLKESHPHDVEVIAA